MENAFVYVIYVFLHLNIERRAAIEGAFIPIWSLFIQWPNSLHTVLSMGMSKNFMSKNKSDLQYKKRKKRYNHFGDKSGLKLLGDICNSTTSR
jgi:hypothetical protein